MPHPARSPIAAAISRRTFASRPAARLTTVLRHQVTSFGCPNLLLKQRSPLHPFCAAHRPGVTRKLTLSHSEPVTTRIVDMQLGRDADAFERLGHRDTAVHCHSIVERER